MHEKQKGTKAMKAKAMKKIPETSERARVHSKVYHNKKAMLMKKQGRNRPSSGKKACCRSVARQRRRR